MEASLRGGDRQELHERIRQHSLEAYARVSAGEPNPLIDLIAADPSFGLGRDELESLGRRGFLYGALCPASRRFPG